MSIDRMGQGAGGGFVAKAYGVRTPTPAVLGRIGGPSAPAKTEQAASVASAAQVKKPAGTANLVAAVVPGKVDFSGEQLAPGAGQSLAFYRRPSDRNEVATVMSLGKSVDLVG